MTEPACRICYETEEVGPLISPCDCRGSIQYTHKRCLYEWLVVDGRGYCELCNCAYMFEELVLEPIYEPRDFRILRLATRTHLLFILQLLFYILYLLLKDTTPPQLDLESSPTQTALMSIGGAIPYMLIGLASLQARVLGPAIWILNNKVRYLRYLMIRPPGFRLYIPLFLSIILGAFFLSFHFPIAGSVVYVHFMSYLYDAHCQIVNTINRDMITKFYLE
jgi:hypothetical protein